MKRIVYSFSLTNKTTRVTGNLPDNNGQFARHSDEGFLLLKLPLRMQLMLPDLHRITENSVKP